MKCTHPITLRTGTFNCGQCHACRINYTSGWTLRLLYELTCWDCASFITLTYDDYHLPLDMSLHLHHVQKFMDNLRHRIDWKIKYYHCGEYGEKRKRPHYHIILFGLDPFNEEHRKIVYECWQKCDPMFFDKLPSNWKTSKSCQGKGMLPVCREDIAYVCGYVQKKLSGEMAENEYGKKKDHIALAAKESDWNILMKKRIIYDGYSGRILTENVSDYLSTFEKNLILNCISIQNQRKQEQKELRKNGKELRNSSRKDIHK